LAGSVVQTTNTLSVALAPTLPLPSQTATTVVNSDGSTTVTVSFTPAIWEGQDVSLALSSTTPPVAPATLYTMTGPAQPFTGNGNVSLGFQFPASQPSGWPPPLPSGPLLGRLIVDGVTSQVQVDFTKHPPVFTGPMVTIP